MYYSELVFQWVRSAHSMVVWISMALFETVKHDMELCNLQKILGPTRLTFNHGGTVGHALGKQAFGMRNILLQQFPSISWRLFRDHWLSHY